MGLYTKVLEGKPHLGADASQREQVEAWKAKIRATPGFVPSAGTITEIYADTRDAADEVRDALNDLNAKAEALRQMLVERAEIEGISSLRLSNGRGVVIVTEPYANIIDPEAFRLWCLEQGFAHKMALHPSTAKSLVKERLLAGEAEPPGVEIYSKETIRLDKRKK